MWRWFGRINSSIYLALDTCTSWSVWGATRPIQCPLLTGGHCECPGIEPRLMGHVGQSWHYLLSYWGTKYDLIIWEYAVEGMYYFSQITRCWKRDKELKKSYKLKGTAHLYSVHLRPGDVYFSDTLKWHR